MMAATKNGTNWKNVNNWHWVDKNCIVWTKDYFKQLLENTSVEKDGIQVKISELSDLTGDCDLNQRKGKIITIYDVALTLKWEGSKGDVTAKGKINIPEFMHDTKLQDIVFEVSVDADNKEKEVIKKLLKSDLLPIVRQKFSTFESDLAQAHLKDVYIPPSDKPQATFTPYQPKPPAPVLDSAVSNKVVGGTADISITVEFVCNVQDIFQTLTDANRARIWSRGNAVTEAKVGSKFSFFDGNISGEYLEVVPNKTIVQKWRLKSWPESHYSHVTFTFDDKGDSTSVKIVQKQVPVAEKDVTKTNWHQYYFNPIKSMFGYGAVL